LSRFKKKGKAIFDEDSFKSKYAAIYSKFVVTKSTVKGTATFAGSRGFKREFKEFDPGFATLVDGFSPLVEKIQAGKAKKDSFTDLALSFAALTLKLSGQR
jgi:hypothetical protein